jgi:acyl-CoA synthetase (NDP forming)
MAACDVCEAGGLQIVPFGTRTQTAINEFLPPLAMRTNPVDMGPAWYDSAAVREIVRSVMEDPAVSGILLLMMFASANRETVPDLSELVLRWRQKKPLVTCLVAPPGVWDPTLNHWEREGAVANFPTPERAAGAMAGLWRYRQILDRQPN